MTEGRSVSMAHALTEALGWWTFGSSACPLDCSAVAAKVGLSICEPGP